MGAISKTMRLNPLHNNPFFLPRWCVTVYVATCCIAFAVLASSKGFPNWDMLGYVASIRSVSTVDAGSLHAGIYADAKAYLSAADYEELVAKDSYRQTMAADAELFSLQIPYYKIRWLFLGLISALESLGVHVFSAGHIIAASAASIAGFVLYSTFKNSISAYMWLLFPLVFALSGALETARIYSPDALSLLFFALTFYLYVKEHWLFFVLLAVSVFVRTDLIVLVGLCATLLFLSRPALRVPATLSFLLALGFYFLINTLSGNHGWAVVHYYVFESNMQAADPRLFAEHSVSLGSYLGAIARAVPTVFYYPALLYFLFCSVLSALLLARKAKFYNGLWRTFLAQLEDPRFVAILVANLYVIAHFVLFPLLDTRFFAGPYFITALCFLSLISEEMDHSVTKSEA